MAGKAPVPVPVSGSGTADLGAPGRPRGRLAGRGRGQGGGNTLRAARALPWKLSIFSLALQRQGQGGKAEQASREIHLFQNKGTEITHQRHVLSASSPWCGRLDKTPAGRAPSLPAAGSGQGQGAPGILSHRGRDFGRRGQADAYVQPLLT